ncbi:MAG: hypothetical protein WC530_00630 [Candidatus Omnitrophota bacterium]
MNVKQSGRLAIFCFFCLVFPPSLLHLASAQQEIGSEERGQEASASQTQATMASLFGRGARVPEIPRISGTIALPAFSNSGMTIDDGTLRTVQRGERSSGRGER